MGNSNTLHKACQFQTKTAHNNLNKLLNINAFYSIKIQKNFLSLKNVHLFHQSCNLHQTYRLNVSDPKDNFDLLLWISNSNVPEILSIFYCIPIGTKNLNQVTRCTMVPNLREERIAPPCKRITTCMATLLYSTYAVLFCSILLYLRSSLLYFHCSIHSIIRQSEGRPL